MPYFDSVSRECLSCSVFVLEMKRVYRRPTVFVRWQRLRDLRKRNLAVALLRISCAGRMVEPKM